MTEDEIYERLGESFEWDRHKATQCDQVRSAFHRSRNGILRCECVVHGGRGPFGKRATVHFRRPADPELNAVHEAFPLLLQAARKAAKREVPKAS